MGRIYTRVHRLLRLIAAIQSRSGLNVPDLARLCEVHERTVYRDIETLNASGVPCFFDNASHGYRVAPGFFMPPVELTLEESMAIIALLEEVGDGTQIPFLGAAARAVEKLRSQLPVAVLDSIEPVDGHLHIDLARSAGDDSCRDVYDDVRAAIAVRRILLCTYDAASKTNGLDNLNPTKCADSEFELRPYALWFCQRAWYVVGHHSGRGDLHGLCSSNADALGFHASVFENLFKEAPELGGLILIVGGESYYHCFMRSAGSAVGETNCPHCKGTDAEEQIAHLVKITADAATAQRPEARVMAWPYSAWALAGGYFTAKQAAEAGYGYTHLTYHLKAGNFGRADHGLYRIVTIPQAGHDDLIRLSLWSRNRRDVPQAVVSHETALALRQLSDVLPRRVHLSVPRTFRKQPPSHCVLHRATLSRADAEQREGFFLTTPLHTLLDVAGAKTVTDEQLSRAVDDALDRGLVRKSKLEVAVRNTPGAARLLRPWRLRYRVRSTNNSGSC